MAGSKISGQVSALTDTGMNTAATGFGAKSTEPKVPPTVHNRGITIGGKAHATSGTHPVGKQGGINTSVPKGPHPAMAKKTRGNPGVKWG